MMLCATIPIRSRPKRPRRFAVRGLTVLVVFLKVFSHSCTCQYLLLMLISRGSICFFWVEAVTCKGGLLAVAGLHLFYLHRHRFQDPGPKPRQFQNFKPEIMAGKVKLSTMRAPDVSLANPASNRRELLSCIRKSK